MASLPKIRRTRVGGRPAAPAQPERTTADVQRLDAYGLTWLNIESPAAIDAQWLAANYDFHELDIEDVCPGGSSARRSTSTPTTCSSCCTSRGTTSGPSACRRPSSTSSSLRIS